jgi:hypothetical protein
MRTLIACLTTLFLSTVWADGPAPAPPSSAPAAGSTAQLGKIDVKGLKVLVETLREVKVAVKRPFGNDPAHFDDMVCRLGDDEGSHISMVLECGTQGWFSMRRDQYLFGGGYAVVTLGHPWHMIRPLTPRQMKTLRDLLREIPAPGKGDVKVLDDQNVPVTQ